MKTLYISDLDGTLLRSDACVSEYTARTINSFVKRGGCFSYATARSIGTASKVIAGLNLALPVICANGVFIYDSLSKERLLSNFFAQAEAEAIANTLLSMGVFPMVYAYINGAEKISYIEKHAAPALKSFLSYRENDPRRRLVQTAKELFSGDIFRFACWDTEEALLPLENHFKYDDRVECIYQKEKYSGEWSCEILPKMATKANAALQLKAMLGCDRIVAFGDAVNDLPLFSVADEKYAVANAEPEVKAAATAVIGSNDDDGVAIWIAKNAFPW